MASSAFSSVWVVLIRDTLTILALLIYMMIVSWHLILVLLVVVPVNVILIDRASKKIRRASKQIQQHMGKMTEHLEQRIRGYKEIKIYTTEDYENNLFEGIVNNVFGKTMRVTCVSTLNVPLI